MKKYIVYKKKRDTWGFRPEWQLLKLPTQILVTLGNKGILLNHTTK